MLGLLDDYPTRSGYLITPVVVWAGAEQAIAPNPAEVASVHRDPARHDRASGCVRLHRHSQSTRRVIRFHWEDRLIHAPTAAMIYQFREVLGGRDTRVADLEQPVFAWK